MLRELSRLLSTTTASVHRPIVPEKVVEHAYTTKNYKWMPGFSFPAPRSLEQVVKLALLEREPPARIREIWNEHHAPRLDSVATVWGAEELAALAERRRRCPRFVYPVLKGDGKFFNLLAEWQDKFCIFTYLEDYRKDPSRAEPYLSVALYEDLLARKGLVLVRGDFSGHLTKRDAAHVLNLMRHFYFVEPRWVETFNKEPAAFDFSSFVAAVPRPPEKHDADAGKVKF
jgi:ATP synthase F1 complex assembly factor 1